LVVVGFCIYIGGEEEWSLLTLCSLVYLRGNMSISAYAWTVRGVPAGAEIEGSRNINTTRMAKEKNVDEGMLKALLFPCFYWLFIFGFIFSWSCRYRKRKVDWRRMKKKQKRCGRESVSTRSSGKEQEDKGFVSITLF
jgi:hypothetical protein